MRRTPGIALAALACAAIGLACGEDVDFVTRQPGAGPQDAAPLADASIAGDAATDATANAPDGSPEAGTGDVCPPGFEGGICKPNGAICRAAHDCCEGRCEEGYCLPPGACAAPGAPCVMRSNCCSQRCEPTGHGGGLACAAFCAADGARCADPSDCCSLACHGGVCGGVLCNIAGTMCVENSDCCSDRCTAGRCQESTGACLPTGEGCGDDAGPNGGPGVSANANRCCSGFCDTTANRCDLGPGGCREASVPCLYDGECCRGNCVSNAQGVSVCTAPCLADGENCNSNGDCCDGLCAGPESKCGTPTPHCP